MDRATLLSCLEPVFALYHRLRQIVLPTAPGVEGDVLRVVCPAPARSIAHAVPSAAPAEGRGGAPQHPLHDKPHKPAMVATSSSTGSLSECRCTSRNMFYKVILYNCGWL